MKTFVSKNEFFGYFLENASLFLAEIVLNLDIIYNIYWSLGQKNSFSPIFGLFLDLTAVNMR